MIDDWFYGILTALDAGQSIINFSKSTACDRSNPIKAADLPVAFHQAVACTVALRSSLPQPTSTPRSDVRVLLIAT